MTEKLKPTVRGFDEAPSMPTATDFLNKINELVDIVNTIQKGRETEWFEIQEWISILEAVRKSVNVHEKQIDELQMKLEPEKCEIPADPYTEQRKWIGCVCRFWFNNKKQADIGILGDIDEDDIHPYFNADLGHNYKCCEPVKPNDDIIYKGE